MFLLSLALIQQVIQTPSDSGAPLRTLDAFWNYSGFFRQLEMGNIDRSLRYPCPREEPGDIKSLLDLQKRWAAQAQAPNAAPTVWRKLSCIREALFFPSGGATDHDEFLMQRGTSWRTGAIRALLKGLALDPHDTISLQLLSHEATSAAPGHLLPIHPVSLPVYASQITDAWEFGGASDISPAAMTLYRAVESGIHVPELMRGCASLMIATGQISLAHECSRRALEAGVDSTWHLLRLSWVAFGRSDSVAGARFFERAVHAAHDHAIRIELGWHLESQHDYCMDIYWMWPSCPQPNQPELAAEKERWLALPDSVLAQWSGLARGRVWSGLNRDGLAQHFAGITYNGWAFRDCVSDRDSLPPCKPRPHQFYDSDLDVTAQRYQLWDPSSASQLALFSYSVGPQSEKPRQSANRTVGIHIVQSSDDGRQHRDTAFNMQVATPRDSRSPIARYDLVAMTPGLTNWSVLMEDSLSHRRGGDYQDEQPRLPTDPFVLSDVVVGTTGAGGFTWHLTEDHHGLIPGAAADRHAPLFLYYQVRSSQMLHDLKTTVSFYRGGSAAPVTRVAFAGEARNGVTEREHQVDIGRLEPGQYRVEISIADSRGELGMKSAMVRVK